MSYLLEPVGVRHQDNDVYLALLAAGTATPDHLADDVAITRDEVHGCLDRLCGLGLAVRVSAGRATYAAVPLDAAVPLLIQRRRQALTRLQSSVDLIAQEATRPACGPGSDAVTSIHGPDAVIAAVTRLQGQARGEVLVVDTPPYLGGSPGRNDTELAKLAAGVTYRAVYHPASLASTETISQMRECMRHGEQARVHPGAGPKLLVVDRRAALLVASDSAPDPLHRLLVRPGTLLDLVIAHFEHLWEHAAPLDDSAGAPQLTARDRQLLRLLASGMKDGAIARTLGVTERTVGRRVRNLMDRLSAGSRFQAGVAAAQRDWL